MIVHYWSYVIGHCQNSMTSDSPSNATSAEGLAFKPGKASPNVDREQKLEKPSLCSKTDRMFLFDFYTIETFSSKISSINLSLFQKNISKFRSNFSKISSFSSRFFLPKNISSENILARWRVSGCGVVYAAPRSTQPNIREIGCEG